MNGSLGFLGVVAILALGLFLAGCISGGGQANYASTPSPTAVPSMTDYSDLEINDFPSLDEESGFENATLG